MREDAQADVRCMLWSARLAGVRRFHNQPFWEREGAASDQAAAIEGEPRLESVADHSWKVADAALLLVGHFDWLDRTRVLELALLHDKLELITGDVSPIDRDATGASTHAFNRERALAKQSDELLALQRYRRFLRPAEAERQAAIFEELIFETSDEAKFVKAVDKLASLIFVIQAKQGALEECHMRFTLAYTAKAIEYFPALQAHHDVLVEAFLDRP